MSELHDESVAPSEPPGAAPEPVADLRDRILRSAIRLFAERGYAATSTRQIVEEAGCTKPALYYHFGSKEALFLEAIRLETAVITSFLEVEVDHGTTRERMERLLGAFLAHVRRHPHSIQLLQRAENHPEEGQPSFDFASIRSHHLAHLRGLLAAGQAAGDIRPDLDLDDAASAAVAMVEQRLQLYTRGGALPLDLPERLMRILFEGVGR